MVASNSRSSLLLPRRVSNASMDKVAAAKPQKAPLLKAIKKGATKAKVRFSDAPTRVIAQKDETTTNVNATWYQPKDYAIIKYELLTSIHAITKVFKQQNTTPLDLDKHCLRGIETGISGDLNKRRKVRIRTTLQSVLEQQRRQRMVGASDPLALADVSLQCSQDARESAVSVGQLDSKL